MSLKNFPPEVQEKIKRMQSLQNQLQTINSQIELLQSKTNENKNTLKELSSVTDDVKLYKTVGQIMFSSTSTEVKKELEENLELAELNLERLKKHKEKMENELKEVNTYLNQVVASQQNFSPS